MEAWRWIGVVGGGLMLVAGIWVLRASRRPKAGRVPMSTPTRLVLGLSLGFVGYHVVAWTAPAGWISINVPWERGWLVGLLVVVSLAVSVTIDRIEADRT